MRLTLGITGLRPAFEGQIFSSEDVARGKPAPDLFLHAAAQMGYEPHRCVVVEDSPAGVAAAHAARITVIGYTARTPRNLLASADGLFESMDDLPAAIVRLYPSAQ
jgi:beta-phosphoglucomutase-like phosphatase (HAD superfamily)